ncbi:MAG: hypothetical protein HYV07_12285 [Deltaproteobacteria bacterium]|nr:hypothetical protein [Deltaproteobacteria bacterium]
MSSSTSFVLDGCPRTAHGGSVRRACSVALWAISAGSVACSGSTVLPLPVEAPSVLLLVVLDSRPPRAYAAEPAAGAVVEVELDDLEEFDARLFALMLDQPLAEAGLTAGWSDVTAGELPFFEQALAAEVRAGVPSSWSEVQELPRDTDGFGVPIHRPTDCRRIVANPIKLPGTARHRATFGLVEGAGSALVGTGAGIFRLKPGSVEKVSDEVVVAALIDESSRLWLLRETGELVAGSIDSGFELVVRLPEALGGQAMIDGTSDELFIATARQVLFQVRGQRIDRFELERTDGDAAYVVRTGQGAATALSRKGLDLNLLSEGKLERVTIIDGPLREIVLESFHAMARVPGLGVFATGNFGYLFRSEDGRAFEQLDERIGRLAKAVVPLDGGIVFGAHNGTVYQWHESAGTCPEQLIVAPTNLGVGASLGRSAVVLEEGPNAVDLSGAEIFLR